ncbi:MAG: hypothetical protein MUC47_04645 [Candidatus Kapabacteria bacterium]|jgi:hypothetical protein|nr:hypothetical protein [Candidatus Kapabacteria bacterium]
MIWKSILIVSLISMAAGTIVWLAEGAEMLTKDRKRVEKVVKDELFGTTSTVVTFEEDPNPPFALIPLEPTPLAIVDSLAFVLGAGITLAGISIVMIRRSKRSQ